MVIKSLSVRDASTLTWVEYACRTQSWYDAFMRSEQLVGWLETECPEKWHSE